MTESGIAEERDPKEHLYISFHLRERADKWAQAPAPDRDPREREKILADLCRAINVRGGKLPYNTHGVGSTVHILEQLVAKPEDVGLTQADLLHGFSSAMNSNIMGGEAWDGAIYGEPAVVSMADVFPSAPESGSKETTPMPARASVPKKGRAQATLGHAFQSIFGYLRRRK